MLKKSKIDEEISKLKANKASQITGIPINIIKNNTNIFSDFLCTSFSTS